MTCGAPQCCLLSLLIYMNDLKIQAGGVEFLLYADDTVLCMSGTNQNI